MLGLVVRDGIKLAAGGVLAGAVVALFLARLMEGLVYGVRPLDPLTFLVVPALFAAVAILASYLPARQAASADPAVTFRDD